MSAKQSQITSFFSQNKKQKINDDSDGNSGSVDILSNSLNEPQGGMELCAEIPSLTSSSSTSAPLVLHSSISVLSTSIGGGAIRPGQAKAYARLAKGRLG